jgi:hypothetical protein
MKQLKQISAYHHFNQLLPNSKVVDSDSEQMPDTQPGSYYVSAVDVEKFALVSGPYQTHAEALAAVQVARAIAVELSPWCAFSAFGTVRCKSDCAVPGRLQEWGYSLELEKV